jgi:DNA polymerase-3 subunit beta
MRCRIETLELRTHLAIVAGAAMPKGTRPEWSILQLQARAPELVLAIENAQFGITSRAMATVMEPGVAYVPARLMIDFLGSVDDAEVELHYDDEVAVLAILCSAYDPHIRGMAMPTGINMSSIAMWYTIAAPVLLESIGDTYYGASTNDQRPALTAVLLQLRGTSIYLTATDGSRLIQRRSEIEGEVSFPHDLLVPAKALQEALRVFSGESGNLRIGLSEAGNLMSIDSADGNQLRTRLLSGRYPDVTRLIGLEGATTVRTSAAEFERKVRATNLFAIEGDHTIRMIVHDGALLLVASSREVGDIQTAVEADVMGEDCRVAINGRYMSEVCQRIGDSDTEVQLTNENSPVIVRRLDDAHFECVIMPTRIAAW